MYVVEHYVKEIKFLHGVLLRAWPFYPVRSALKRAFMQDVLISNIFSGIEPVTEQFEKC